MFLSNPPFLHLQNDFTMNRFIILLFAAATICTAANAQDIPIEKFIGIWRTNQEYWESMPLKISQENGRIIVQIKGNAHGEATLDGDRLKMTLVEETNYGKFWVGKWGGWYDSDGEWVSRSENEILVGHSDGGYGTYGPVSGFYSERYRKSVAIKKVKYYSIHIVYKFEGTLELYFTYHSTYYDGTTPLFYQGREEHMYRIKPIIYTNW